ncbi:MAG: transposase [Anaerolineaceae bacterium]|nr:transposase [Anaerolineaceae bacterium]
MVERLWRTVKYEDVYLRDYETPAEARLGLARYFAYYDHLRRHRSLGRRTPAEVYGLALSTSDQKLLARPSRNDRIEIPALADAGDRWRCGAVPHRDRCCRSGRPTGSLRDSSGNVTPAGGSTLSQPGICLAHGDKLTELHDGEHRGHDLSR